MRDSTANFKFLRLSFNYPPEDVPKKASLLQVAETQQYPKTRLFNSKSQQTFSTSKLLYKKVCLTDLYETQHIVG